MAGALEGRVALVTGASRGIGAAIAERFAAEGAHVALAARSLHTHPDHLPGTLAEVAARLRGRGVRVTAIGADLSDPAERPRIVRAAEAALGPIDILVNNAAAAFYIPFERISEKRLRIAWELNVRGPFELCQLVAPGMRARRRGYRQAEMVERMRRAIPLGRVAEPAEIGAVACFLLSDDASYLNGQVIAVDGGATVR